MQNATGKVTTSHLGRDAYLYVRQSSLRQVVENQESTKRQYALRERAVGLGWPVDRIHVIDCDLGMSGASSRDRKGFKELVSRVSLGDAGIVLGLEVSRLARNCSDWHRLLELCAMTETLIMDDDGLYNPNDFNDRLLLGLKGTMSEAELHLLRARLRGGILNKARRGELPGPLPVGFVYDAHRRVRLDPDQQVQEAIRTLFEVFRATGTARQVVQHFRRGKLLFPLRLRSGPAKGALQWQTLAHHSVLRVLHNPCYAGAFSFGRHRYRPGTDGRTVMTKVPREQWLALVRDAHEGYIDWDRFEENLRRLTENAQGWQATRSQVPAREGPALLQGLAICARCGRKLTPRYNRQPDGSLVPTYACVRGSIEYSESICQTVPGRLLDQAFARLLLEKLTPHMLEVAMAVQCEVISRMEETRQLRHMQVERAQYEAELARTRFVMVDPRNRLVAEVLEAEWNGKLRQWQEEQERYDRECQRTVPAISEELRAQILALAADLPTLWGDPGTSDLERKRIVRLLVEDVTLLRDGKDVTASVRFKGGATETLQVRLPESAPVRFKTPVETVRAVDALLEEYADDQIAAILTQRGFRAGRRGHAGFTRTMVRRLRMDYDLTPRFDRLRARGMLTVFELAAKLNVCPATVGEWRRQGLLEAHRFSAKDEYLYLDIDPAEAPEKFKHKLRTTASRTTAQPD